MSYLIVLCLWINNYSKLQIIEMRKSGNSAYDDGYTVATSDIGEILYTAIIVH